MTRRRWWSGVTVTLALLLALVGCGGADPADPDQAAEVASPLDGCEELTAPPSNDPPEPARVAPLLPPLTLPCFTGEAPFELPRLRGPAVVNLWASWCTPCRDELPVLQRYADRAAGEVHVIGVVTSDTRPRAAALAEDLELRFPAIYDRNEELLAAIGLNTLPVTLFVDRDGGVQFVYRSRPYDDQRLAELVEEHLQVTVPDD